MSGSDSSPELLPSGLAHLHPFNQSLMCCTSAAARVGQGQLTYSHDQLYQMSQMAWSAGGEGGPPPTRYLTAEECWSQLSFALALLMAYLFPYHQGQLSPRKQLVRGRDPVSSFPKCLR